jgi:hypothetical protein
VFKVRYVIQVNCRLLCSVYVVDIDDVCNSVILISLPLGYVDEIA